MTSSHTPPVLEAEEKKLTRIPKGHWRNQWRIFGHAFDEATGEELPEGTALGATRFPSRELAEESAIKITRNNPRPQDCIYIGAVFFPDDGGGQ